VSEGVLCLTVIMVVLHTYGIDDYLELWAVIDYLIFAPSHDKYFTIKMIKDLKSHIDQLALS